MNIKDLHIKYLNTTGVVTDTRKIQKDCFFICLRGANFNGNQFAKEALQKGAAYVLVDDSAVYEEDHPQMIWSENSLEAFQQLGKYHREQFSIPIIGLTGSNGKTTTKELIRSVLAEKYRVLATEGNLNNHIGVPLTLLRIDPSTEIAIIEMGANHKKEIEKLAALSQPTHGYITNFGKAHLEGFGGIEGVIEGKSELYLQLKRTGSLGFINADDSLQVEKTKQLKTIGFSFKNQTADLFLEGNVLEEEELELIFEGTKIHPKIRGEYNLTNIGIAVVIGAHFKLHPTEIKKGIEGYEPQNNRSEWRITDTNRILLDAYNANPSSMQAAIVSFGKLIAENKILILGDMLELGPYKEAEHLKLIEQLVREGWSNVLLVGPIFYQFKDQSPFLHFETLKEAKDHLEQNPIKKASLLLKGSRGIALEQLLPRL